MDKIREAREAAAAALAKAETADEKTAQIYRQIASGWAHIADDLEYLEKKNYSEDAAA